MKHKENRSSFHKFLLLPLVFLFVFCLVKIWKEIQLGQDIKQQESTVRQLEPKEDENMWDELLKINPDICGWLDIKDTEITCPVVFPPDNSYYLRRDIWGEYSIAGTPFIDYRCQRDFSMFHTILYGHNMSNGSMFADVVKFKQSEYFASHTLGTLYTPDVTWQIELFACLLEDMDSPVYDVYFYSPEERDAYLSLIRKQAVQYRDIGVTEQDRLLSLSTCSYEFKNARTILIGRLQPITETLVQ